MSRNIKEVVLSQPYASRAALSGSDITTIDDGVLGNVKDIGIYQLRKTSTETVNGTTVLTTSTGTGRWIFVSSSDQIESLVTAVVKLTGVETYSIVATDYGKMFVSDDILTETDLPLISSVQDEFCVYLKAGPLNGITGKASGSDTIEGLTQYTLDNHRGALLVSSQEDNTWRAVTTIRDYEDWIIFENEDIDLDKTFSGRKIGVHGTCAINMPDNIGTNGITEGWYVDLVNLRLASGNGTTSFNPKASDKINNLSSITFQVGQSARISCNGIGFFTSSLSNDVVGSMASQNSDGVAITGGTLTNPLLTACQLEDCTITDGTISGAAISGGSIATATINDCSITNGSANAVNIDACPIGQTTRSVGRFTTTASQGNYFRAKNSTGSTIAAGKIVVGVGTDSPWMLIAPLSNFSQTPLGIVPTDLTNGSVDDIMTDGQTTLTVTGTVSSYPTEIYAQLDGTVGLAPTPVKVGYLLSNIGGTAYNAHLEFSTTVNTYCYKIEATTSKTVAVTDMGCIIACTNNTTSTSVTLSRIAAAPIGSSFSIVNLTGTQQVLILLGGATLLNGPSLLNNGQLVTYYKVADSGTVDSWVAISIVSTPITSSAGILNLTFSGPFTQAISVPYQQIGATVTLRFPNMQNTASSSTFFTSTSLPAALTPVEKQDQPIRIQNSGAFPTALGCMRVTTSGTLELYKDFSGGVFNAGASCGIESGAITYSLG